MTRTRRIIAPVLVTAAIVSVLAAAGAAGAQGAPPTAPEAPIAASSIGVTGATGATTAPELTATLVACHTDALAANRYAIFAAQTVAAAVPGTIVMAVQVKLQERSAAGAAFVAVRATGFGAWVTSDRRVGTFTYNHEVTALPAPAAFRVLVRARWIGRHRRILHETAAISPVCVQPVLTPDVVVGRILRTAGTSRGTAQYIVEIRNDGSAPAGPFQVSLTVGATALAPVTIPALDAGAVQQAVFSGPACAAPSTLTAVADQAGAVVEPADPRRTVTLDCPIP